jgi:hypothetical protein
MWRFGMIVLVMGLVLGAAIQAPLATHSQGNCPGAPPSQLALGSRARVSLGRTNSCFRPMAQKSRFRATSVARLSSI